MKQATSLSLAMLVSSLLFSPESLGDSTRVCVDVVVRDTAHDSDEPPSGEALEAEPEVEPEDEIDDEWEEEVIDMTASSKPVKTIQSPKPLAIKHISYDPKSLSGPQLPLGQTPEVYLERLFEYYITHEPGFEAVDGDCQETIRVEMYPLDMGWTVFARYTGNSREERIDQVLPTELSQFAERATLALLQNKPISTTINKGNVLKADSKKSAQKIKGTNHFSLGVGAQIRLGMFDTAVTDSGSSDYGGVNDQIRVFGPMMFQLGYRGQFETWGLETMCHVAIGTQKTSAHKNPAGGHIDFGGDAGLQFHFYRYTKPRGLVSFYFGSGATFELLWFTAVRRLEDRHGDSRKALVSGGLDVDVVFGWEFMRASSVQFYLQGELNAPVYVIQSENGHGSIRSWFPGVSLKIGIVF
jgi:hypothetical protein